MKASITAWVGDSSVELGEYSTMGEVVDQIERGVSTQQNIHVSRKGECGVFYMEGREIQCEYFPEGRADVHKQVKYFNSLLSKLGSKFRIHNQS